MHGLSCYFTYQTLGVRSIETTEAPQRVRRYGMSSRHYTTVRMSTSFSYYARAKWGLTRISRWSDVPVTWVNL